MVCVCGAWCVYVVRVVCMWCMVCVCGACCVCVCYGECGVWSRIFYVHLSFSKLVSFDVTGRCAWPPAGPLTSVIWSTTTLLVFARHTHSNNAMIELHITSG